MSYDISFTGKLPDADALGAYFAERRGWEWDDGSAGFEEPASGAEFHLHRSDDSLSLSMSGSASHVVGPILVREVRALVDHFGLQVSDPQMEGMGDGPLDEGKLLAGWRFYNNFSLKTSLTLLGQEPPPHLPAAKLEAAVAWNRAKESLEEGDDWFIPSIAYVAGEGGTAETYVAWVGGPGSLPVVDRLITPMAHVRWEALAEALAGVPVVAEPAPHVRVDSAVAEKIDAVIAGSAPLEELPTSYPVRRLRSTEQVKPYLGSIFESTDTSMLESAAMLAHQTNDRKKAFGCGRRLVELDPTSHTGAIVGAINGFYLAEFAEALKLVDAALAAHPGDRTAHIVRCGVLTDLGRYDEAIADADAALAGERDAMVVNMKAFALAAADRAAEAKANYEEALALIDAGLVESPDDGDVVSRRAYALVGLGRGEEALGAAERALELVDDSFLTLQSLGRAHLLVGKPEAAIEPLEKARAQREAAPLASYYLALAFARCDRREDARAALVDAARSPHFVAQAKREPLLAALL